ncbi:hypothetical protein BGY98DRAFT_972565, partial [Russula aff. rugulosa BPL654]
MLVDLFERIGRFFKRLESYTERMPSEAMTDMMVEVMVESPLCHFSRKIPEQATRQERR